MRFARFEFVAIFRQFFEQLCIERFRYPRMFCIPNEIIHLIGVRLIIIKEPRAVLRSRIGISARPKPAIKRHRFSHSIMSHLHDERAAPLYLLAWLPDEFRKVFTFQRAGQVDSS